MEDNGGDNRHQCVPPKAIRDWRPRGHKANQNANFLVPDVSRQGGKDVCRCPINSWEEEGSKDEGHFDGKQNKNEGKLRGN
jgi:hypothetical protein